MSVVSRAAGNAVAGHLPFIWAAVLTAVLALLALGMKRSEA
jgi:hypothetical protein